MAQLWDASNPDVREILDKVAEIGWTISTTKSGYRVQAPGGGTAMLHKNPSDHRWVDNTWRDLNRAGYRQARAEYDQASAGRREALREAARTTTQRLLDEAQRKADQRQAEALTLARAAGWLTDTNLLFTPNPGPPRTYTVIITPELAAELDALNVDNQRNISPRRVDLLAEKIDAGTFMHTHQGIAISTEGNMVDGMHRTRAIMQAGKNVTMQVTIGVDPRSFAVIDTGKSRTGGDALRIAGYDHTPKLAAAARLLYTYNVVSDAEANGRPAPSWKTIRLTNADVLEVVESTDGGLQAAVEFDARMKLAGTVGLVPASAAVGAYLIHRVWDPASPPIVRWWEGLLNPYGLGAEDPRAALHRNLVNSQIRRRRRDAYPQLPLLLKVFNYAMTGATLQLASWKEQEGLPVVIEPTANSVGVADRHRAAS